ncbi:Zinc metalloproteinase nas-5 [Colletotrichum shisoi]|uniref:Metalloendopeptidase n=1 Tax=Colletotrichum shisoi TaxID=2078593 RepID=A0A5Q4BCC5_9PEZI|nr:Zinc metalloproteinase nas-5 [Colletotrichum shisoi]
MVYVTLKASVAVALALSQTAVAALFPANMHKRSEVEAMPLEKRGSMSQWQLWDKAEIPYILKGLQHDLSDHIRDAMRAWEQNTCIRFIPKKDQPAWVSFKKYDEGCWAQRLGSPNKGEVQVNFDHPNAWEQIVSMGQFKGCSLPRTAGQLLGHIIGLINEQQRPDRDQFIKVMENRIQPQFLDQFTINPEANASVPFDYNSLMLFDDLSFAKRNGWTWLLGKWSLKKTMKSVTDKKIRPWKTPTANDYAAVNGGYACPEYFRRSIPECRAGAIPADSEHSSYSFLLDHWTEKYMFDNAFTHVAAHQDCRSNTAGQDRDNWGFAPLSGSGPDAQYKIITDRCEKGFDRHASRYEVALCRGADKRLCDVRCGLRRVCPVDANGKQVDSKAIDIVDDALWVCHGH